MLTSSESKSLITVSLVASMVLHLTCFMGLGAYIYFSKPEEAVKKETQKQPKPAEKPTQVTLAMLKPQLQKEQEKEQKQLAKTPQPPIKEKKEEEKKEEKNALVVLPSMRERYERTTAAQESSEPLEKTELYGSRNTTASSDRAPDSNAPKVAAIDGKKQIKNNQDIINTRFRDGKVEDEGGGKLQPKTGDPEGYEKKAQVNAKPTPPTPTEKKQPNQQSTAEAETKTKAESMEALLKKVDPLGMVEAEKQQQAREVNNKDNSKTVKVGEAIASQQRQQAQKALIEKAKAKAKKEKQAYKAQLAAQKEIQRRKIRDKIRKQKGQKKKHKDPFAKAAGMQSEVKKNRIRGSISRRGVGSRNVRSTPLGRYKEKIMRAVEKKWQIECRLKADRLLPGSISVVFYVDKRGKVVSTNFVETHAGTQIQKGITYQAIKQAEIPKMPSSLQKTLRGRPVEVWINFSFN